MKTPTRKPPTVEQARRLEEVNRRNRAIQETPLKPPKSGTFGKGVPNPPRKGRSRAR